MGKCKTLTVNGTPYDVLRLLGKGNGGYSFLVRSQTHPPVLYVLKQIHYGPYDYYQYDDKMQAEIRDYRKLRELGVKLPAMLDIDLGHDRILKEYVDGPTIYELVLADQMQDDYLEQIRRLAKRLAAKRLNISTTSRRTSSSRTASSTTSTSNASPTRTRGTSRTGE